MTGSASVSETGNNDGMITLDVADRVATITLNDPGRRNIVSAALNAAIVEGMDELESRDDVGAIVVTGAPPAFCAGADLDDLAACDTEEKLRTIYSGFLRLADSPLPTKPYATFQGDVTGDVIGAPAHTSAIEFSGQWYLFYHLGSEVNNGKFHRRSVCFDKMEFNEDGTIKPVAFTLGKSLGGQNESQEPKQ